MIHDLHPQLLLDIDRIPERHHLLMYPQADAADRDACRDAVLDRDYSRESLATVLAAYNQAIGNDPAALANCAILRDPRACVLVTGQQAGLFTGPMYTVFKAVTAIKLARQESARLGSPVVPIFWNATEDHDLSEIAVCRFPGKELRAGFPATGLAGECLLTRPACEGPLGELLASCSEFHRDELENLLALTDPHYGTYSSSLLARLFAGSGLIIMEPRLLRAQSVGFFSDCCRHREEIRQALNQQGARLKALGLTPSFHAGDGFGLFYIDSDGRRSQILEEDGWLLAGGESLSETEMLQKISASPLSFSTGAYLRPLIQSLCLPNIAFIAGPGEYQYHLQLRPIYEIFDAVMPPLVLRNHATLLGPAERRSVEKLGLSIEDLFADAACFHQALELPDERAVPFFKAEQKLRDAAKMLLDETGDWIEERAVSTFLHKSLEELGKVHKRAAREYQRRHEIDNARVDRLFQALRPGNAPQERQINIFYFLQYRGRQLIDELIELFDPAETRHYVISVESRE